MQTPEALIDVARQAARRHADDIGAATEAFLEAAKDHPDEFAEFQAACVRDSARHLICDMRHADNVQMRREAGDYGGPAKVTAAGDAVLDAYRSLYEYKIAGRSLGAVLGGELAGIAETERAIAAGHEINARLADRLAAIVPEDRCVRDAVSEKKLRRIFKETQAGPTRTEPLAMAGH